jgi:CRP/FNR family cyclic AMP-dependent transcriptional regulator
MSAGPLSELEFFHGLEPGLLAALADLGRDVTLEAGQVLFREGDPADRFFVLRRGRVAVELHDPVTGSHVVDTVEDGDAVGLSWFVTGTTWVFDARALAPTDVVVWDAVRLRAAFDADPALGYAVTQRLARVIYQRLRAARVRMLDLYGARR